MSSADLAEQRLGADLLPRRATRRAWTMPLLACIVGFALMPFSYVIFKPVRTLLILMHIDFHFDVAEHLPSITVILCVAAAVWLLDPARRRYLFYFAAALMVAGAGAQVTKRVTLRTRPQFTPGVYDPVKHAERKARSQAKLEQAGIPPAQKEPSKPRVLDDHYASFPSGHSAAAFAMAAFLALLYPRARRLWLFLAISCALARVRYERHYLDDVLVGGAIGWASALWVFTWNWPARLMSRFSARTAVVSTARAPVHVEPQLQPLKRETA